MVDGLGELRGHFQGFYDLFYDFVLGMGHRAHVTFGDVAYRQIL